MMKRQPRSLRIEAIMNGIDLESREFLEALDAVASGKAYEMRGGNELWHRAYSRLSDAASILDAFIARKTERPAQRKMNSKRKGNVMEPEDNVGREMPRYQCHKKVWALKIAGIVPMRGTPDQENDGSAMITPVEDGFGRFGVDYSYMSKHKPQVGGYYIVYEDGYESYSPAEAFEAGYTLID